MRWLAGKPAGCARLGEYTYVYRDVELQVEKHGRGIFSTYSLHDGYKGPLSRADRRFYREWDMNPRDRLTATFREDGWMSFTKNALLRKLCRAVDSDYRKVAREDQRSDERVWGRAS